MVNSQDGATNHCYHHHLYRGNDCRTVVHGVEELKNSCVPSVASGKAERKN